MREFNILTPGEKIKNLRDKLGLKQEEITGGDVTRNLISIIENNKANLTEHVAKILVENINKQCKEKNMDFSITEEYLLEDVVSQAKKIAGEYIDYINKLDVKEITLIEDTLNEMDIFLKRYNTEEKKAQIYKLIGKKYFNNRLYSKAIEYYLKAYESSINKNLTINVLVQIGVCYIYLSKYEEAIKSNDLLLDLNNNVQVEYVTKFNTALSNKKLGNFDLALKQLKELKENFKEVETPSISEVEVDILSGICLFKLNSFNKSISIYKEILSKTNLTDEQEIITLSNLADVYEVIRDYGKLEEICNRMKSVIYSNIDSMNRYDGVIYIGLAKNLMAIGDNETAKDLLMKALECFKTGNSIICVEDVEDMISLLLNMFIKNGNSSNINYLKNEFFELVQTGMIPQGNYIALKFIQYYNGSNNREEVNNIIEFLAV